MLASAFCQLFNEKWQVRVNAYAGKKSHGIHLFKHLHINKNCCHNLSIILRYKLYKLGFEPTTLWPWLRCYIPELQAHTRYEWTYKQYVGVHYDPAIISNQRLSDKIWLFPIGTIIENIISDIFWGKNIFDLNQGSNPRSLDHEADTRLTELFGLVCNSYDLNKQ